MKEKSWLQSKIDQFKDDLDFRLESLILDITEEIAKGMEAKRINKSGLANLLNISPPAVTKIMNGNSNFTLKTLLTIGDALDLDLKIEFRTKKTLIFQKTDRVISIESLKAEKAYSAEHFYSTASTGVPLSNTQDVKVNPRENKELVAAVGG